MVKSINQIENSEIDEGTYQDYAKRVVDGDKTFVRFGNYYFLKGAKAGRITAKGHVIKRTRKFCLVEVEVFDEEGNLVSKGSFDYYCVSEK